MTRIELLILTGASPASVAVTLEALAVANRAAARTGGAALFDVVVSGSGWALGRAMDAGLTRAPPERVPDLLVVPGLAWLDEARVLEGLERADTAAAAERVRQVSAAGGHVAGSCSGVFLLARAGLLDGRRATTTWWLSPLFSRLFPAVRLDRQEMVVVDGPVTTAGAAMAQLDLMLVLIARYGGAEAARACARYLLLDEGRSQGRHITLSHLIAADPDVARAADWARERLHADFSVEELAAAAGLGARTFARRCARATGLSPLGLLQRMRLERAVELLETESLSFEAISHSVGYDNPAALRRLLKREYGAGPRELRGERRREPPPELRQPNAATGAPGRRTVAPGAAPAR